MYIYFRMVCANEIRERYLGNSAISALSLRYCSRLSGLSSFLMHQASSILHARGSKMSLKRWQVWENILILLYSHSIISSREGSQGNGKVGRNSATRRMSSVGNSAIGIGCVELTEQIHVKDTPDVVDEREKRDSVTLITLLT
jgi:hypothetical protein